LKALLLAAGLGTRLKPITDAIPKCLVPVNGKPLLSYWLDNLSAAGVTEFFINTSYLSEQVDSYINKSRYRNQVTLIHETELLETGGTLLQNKAFFDTSPFFFVYADNLSVCDFSAFKLAHENRPKGTDLTMMTFLTDRPKSCGVIELDDQNVVSAFYEKVDNPPTNLANAAVFILEPSIFEELESLNRSTIDFCRDIVPNLIGRIATFHNDQLHRDIGTIESYAMAQIEMLNFRG
jgi:mannose-1-phosphate guanylyltransferase